MPKKDAFPEGARRTLQDPDVIQLEDGTLVPASDYAHVPDAPTETNVGGFVQVPGHGWSDEALAAREAIVEPEAE